MPKVMLDGSARAQLAYPPKRRKFRRARCATLTLVGLGLGFISGWGCSRGEVGDLPPSVTVASGTLQRIVVATGTLEPERLVDVRPRISGIGFAVGCWTRLRSLSGFPRRF